MNARDKRAVSHLLVCLDNLQFALTEVDNAFAELHTTKSKLRKQDRETVYAACLARAQEMGGRLDAAIAEVKELLS